MPITLKDARLAEGLTQYEMAKKTGLSRMGYNYIETGRRNPSVDNALKIATVVGRSVEDIWGGGKSAKK